MNFFPKIFKQFTKQISKFFQNSKLFFTVLFQNLNVSLYISNSLENIFKLLNFLCDVWTFIWKIFKCEKVKKKFYILFSFELSSFLLYFKCSFSICMSMWCTYGFWILKYSEYIFFYCCCSCFFICRESACFRRTEPVSTALRSFLRWITCTLPRLFTVT